jgi:hypothetical protein
MPTTDFTARKAGKHHRRIDMALKSAHFPPVKEITGLDFEVQPSNDRGGDERRRSNVARPRSLSGA